MSMRTVIVLSALSEMTTPWRIFWRPGPCSRGGVVWASVPARAERAFSRDRERSTRRPSALRRRSASRSAWRSSGVRDGRAFVWAALAARARRRRSLGATTSAGALGAAASGAASAAGASVSSGVSVSLFSVSAIVVQFSFALDRQSSCNLALGPLEARGVLELGGGVLKAQPEKLPAGGQEMLTQLGVAHVAQIGRPHVTRPHA